MGINGRLHDLLITSVAAAVPGKVVKNSDFLNVMNENDMGKFEKMTGIAERRQVVQRTTKDLAREAALVLKNGGHWSPDDLDAVVFVSQTPEYRLPATSCVLHGELGVKKDCIAFDINLGCSGFVYGLYAAATAGGGGMTRRKILLCGGDCISQIVAPGDNSNRMLFGDAGFAAVLETGTGSGQDVPYLMGTDGTGFNAICAKEGKHLEMDGPEVFNFTISAIPAEINRFLSVFGLEKTNVDRFVFHQANKFILKQIAMLSGFPSSKYLYSIDKYGNTSSASIPLTLCANRESAAANVLMAGFGVGLSWGVMAYDFRNTAIYAPAILEED